MKLTKYFSKEFWSQNSNKASKISTVIFFSWLVIGIIIQFGYWFIEHWYFSVLLVFFIAMVVSFIIDESILDQQTKPNTHTSSPNAPINTPNIPTKIVDDPSFLTYKFNKYKQIIYILEEYTPRMRSRQTNVVAFFCVLLIVLTVASIFSKELDNKYVFFGGAFLALTYKVIDMMNANTKTAFDKKTAALDKLIDINFELEKNGQSCEERKSTINSLVKKIVK
ncbi:hypothetical protein [Leuconostoc citreum]|uniref:hypothetical protein n=1 Tax=Leuconostoc citreum TaxID=33964 RepID=UPI000C29143F|nr:hypothetical protein [Leuconostoc citreum]MDY5162551.1 hypothetical protein [Leuconostoc citreum]MDY5166122.1 hypothetical protein [Leuconostoc citreum]